MSSETIKQLIGLSLDIFEIAISKENSQNYEESLKLFEKGLTLLLSIRNLTDVNEHLVTARNCIESMMVRAEKIKKIIDEQNGLTTNPLQPGLHHRFKIEPNSTGHGYNSVFMKFLSTGDVTKIEIEDPYIRDPHHVDNLTRFCEMVVKSPSKVKEINLLTKKDKIDNQIQVDSLEKLRNNLRNHKINLILTYSNSLHDREIRFDNGWIVKIGRGLDYFKRPLNYPALGNFDLDFRQCLETTVDVFHKDTLNMP